MALCVSSYSKLFFGSIPLETTYAPSVDALKVIASVLRQYPPRNFKVSTSSDYTHHCTPAAHCWVLTHS